jgi:hypothetical protein
MIRERAAAYHAQPADYRRLVTVERRLVNSIDVGVAVIVSATRSEAGVASV